MKPKARSSAQKKSKPKTTPEKRAAAAPTNASKLIDQRLAELAGWRGDALASVRALILAADPGVVEEWKWETPVWSHHGIVCTGEAYKAAVKLTFARGAALPDPDRLFTSSLEGNVRRAVDIREGETLAEAPFKRLIKAAIAHNVALAKAR